VENQLVTANSQLMPVTSKDILDRYNRVLTMMGEVMLVDQDYGKVPGCGDKPMLFQPGAEKLCMLFELSANPIVEDLSTADNIHYRVKVEIINYPTQNVVGFGIGECSSDEEKYRWRKAVCDQEYEETDPSRKRAVWKRGYQSNPPYQVKQVRTNPADIANTVLKMAKKRAHVDGVKSATGTSGIFGQDLEDLNAEVAEAITEAERNGESVTRKQKPKVRPPQAKAPYSKPATEAPAKPSTPAAAAPTTSAKSETPAPEKPPETFDPFKGKLKKETIAQLLEMITEMKWTPAKTKAKFGFFDTLGDEAALESCAVEYRAFVQRLK
jgi:hypothetical protein